MIPEENKNSKDLNGKANIEDIKDLTAKSPEVYKPQVKENKSPYTYSQDGSFTVLNRRASSIADWRNALKSVERITYSQYYQLIRIFKDLSEDAEVKSTTDLRINNLLSRYFCINKDGKMDEELTEYFNKPWFQKFIRESLLSIFYGYSCIKIGDIVDDEITEITSLKRENFNPKYDLILKNYSDTDGTSLEEEGVKDWYFKVTPYSYQENYLGIYNAATPYFLHKKDALNAYSDFTNRMGVPSPILKTNLSDEETVQSASQYLQNLNNASFALINLDDEIDFLEASGGSSDIFLKLVDECKRAISKLILGTENIGSESNFVGSAMISASAVDLLAISDIRFIENVFKDQLIPRLVNLGLDFLEGAELEINKDKALTPEDKNFMLDLINSGKYKLPAEFLAEKLGMPIEEVEAPMVDPMVEPSEDEDDDEQE